MLLEVLIHQVLLHLGGNGMIVRQMRIMYLICSIHIWWGMSMLLGLHLPRPFGALEPFFILPYANDFTIGLLLFGSGFLPLTASYWPRNWWCISCLMIPQQLILAWGFLIGGVDVVVSYDGRSWYALGYTGTLFFFHSAELCNEFFYEIVRRKQRRGIG